MLQIPPITYQDEIFELTKRSYGHLFGGFLHGSGGLPDTKGYGTSDVDISAYAENHADFRDHFPTGTDFDSRADRTIYTLHTFPRDVAIFVSAKQHWDNAFYHRNTEIALNQAYPDMARKAWRYKQKTAKSTIEVWKDMFDLGNDYCELMLDTQKTLDQIKAKLS